MRDEVDPEDANGLESEDSTYVSKNIHRWESAEKAFEKV